MSEQKIEQVPAAYHGPIGSIASPLTMDRLEYQGYNSYTGQFIYRCSSCGADVAVNPMEVFPSQRHNNDAHRTGGMPGETRQRTATGIWWVSAWWILYFLLVFFSVSLGMVLLP